MSQLGVTARGRVGELLLTGLEPDVSLLPCILEDEDCPLSFGSTFVSRSPPPS